MYILVGRFWLIFEYLQPMFGAKIRTTKRFFFLAYICVAAMEMLTL